MTTQNANNAGIVAARLVVDDSDFDAKLKAAAGRLDAFASRSNTPTAAPAAKAEAKQIGDAYDEAWAKARIASREAARSTGDDIRANREQIALTKDQLADTSAFSGAGFADWLFGIDDARIKLNKLNAEYRQIAQQIRAVNADIASAPAGSAAAQALAAEKQSLESRMTANQTAANSIKKDWTGVGGALRGIGSTLATSLASSFLIGGGIGIATTALQALVDTGGQIYSRLVDPTTQAANAFDQLGKAIDKIGGSEAFIQFYGLTGRLAELVRSQSTANGYTDMYAGITEIGRTAGAAGRYGLDPATLASQKGREDYRKSVEEQFYAQLGPMNITDPGGMAKIWAAMKNLGPEAMAAGSKVINDWTAGEGRGLGALRPGALDEVVKRAFDAAADASFARLESEGKRSATEKARAAGDKQASEARTKAEEYARQVAMLNRESSSRFLTAADKLLLAAQDQQTAAQKALAQAQASQAAAQERRQLDAASLDVSRSMVGTPGQTMFERTAAYAEAIARRREVQQQIAEQREMRQLQARVATASEAVASAQRAQQIESIDGQIGNLVSISNAMPGNIGAQVLSALSGGQLAIRFDESTQKLIGTLVLPTVVDALDRAERYGTPLPTGHMRGIGG